jgi:hypothetical protein
MTTGQPSGQPSGRPSRHPTSQPSSLPSTQPSCQPSTQPTNNPTSNPTSFMNEGIWYRFAAGVASDSFFGAAWLSSSACVLVGRQLTDGKISYSVNRGAIWNQRVVTGFPLSDVASFVSPDGKGYYLAVSKYFSPIIQESIGIVCV